MKDDQEKNGSVECLRGIAGIAIDAATMALRAGDRKGASALAQTFAYATELAEALEGGAKPGVYLSPNACVKPTAELVGLSGGGGIYLSPIEPG